MLVLSIRLAEICIGKPTPFLSTVSCFPGSFICFLRSPIPNFSYRSVFESNFQWSQFNLEVLMPERQGVLETVKLLRRKEGIKLKALVKYWFKEGHFLHFFFFIRSIWCGPFFKGPCWIFIVLLLYYVLFFWPWSIWDLSFLTRGGSGVEPATSALRDEILTTGHHGSTFILVSRVEGIGTGGIW